MSGEFFDFALVNTPEPTDQLMVGREGLRAGLRFPISALADILAAQGVEGIPGPKGDQGERGPAGADGAGLDFATMAAFPFSSNKDVMLLGRPDADGVIQLGSIRAEHFVSKVLESMGYGDEFFGAIPSFSPEPPNPKRPVWWQTDEYSTPVRQWQLTYSEEYVSTESQVLGHYSRSLKPDEDPISLYLNYACAPAKSYAVGAEIKAISDDDQKSGETLTVQVLAISGTGETTLLDTTSFQDLQKGASLNTTFELEQNLQGTEGFSFKFQTSDDDIKLKEVHVGLCVKARY
ncbi:MAG: collagen-like protein [Cyanobacteria bacterium J06648_10]